MVRRSIEPAPREAELELRVTCCVGSVVGVLDELVDEVRAVLVEVARQSFSRGGERGLQAARAGPDRRGTRGQIDVDEARAENAEAESSNLRDIVLRQKSIKGFWIAPKGSYLKKVAEIKELEARARMAGNGADRCGRGL